jgi:hypothetical protein
MNSETKGYSTVPHSRLSVWPSVIAAILLLLVCPKVARAQSYTLMPSPFQTALDNSGHIINNACVWTYLAGTTTPATTYTDTSGTPQTNPIRADPAGRFTVYLLAGSNYKFTYESSCTPPSHGTTLRTQDNVAGVPASAANVEVQGTAGEALSVGQCAYLSDGSGAKAAGQWFKCDSANTYSSTTPEIGMTPAAIASGSTGTIRLQGAIAGLSSLSVGPEYFVGTAGAITTTAPTNARHVGHADTATSLVLTGDPAISFPNADNGIDDFRLTLTTGTPVTTADVTAATTLYASPYRGNRIALFNSAGVATVVTSTEFSIAVPATTSQMYDVFAFNNSGVATLELLAWTNDTTRATAIVLTTTGTYTKSGDLTRRYLGSFRTTTVSGQTEDSVTKRYVWNYYNRVRRPLLKALADVSWTYGTPTVRQINANTANQVDVVVGVAEPLIELDLSVLGEQNATQYAVISFGEDSTSTISTSAISGTLKTEASGVVNGGSAKAALRKYPPVGRHFYTALEWASGGTFTFYGTPAVASGPTNSVSGISGYIEG